MVRLLLDYDCVLLPVTSLIELLVGYVHFMCMVYFKAVSIIF